MIKKVFVTFFVILFIFPAQAKISNKLIKTGVSKGKENLGISETPLSERNQILKIKSDLKIKNDYLKIKSPELAKKNKNRPPKKKFKGPSEEIYLDYANSVVFIANRKKNGSGSGFIIHHNGKKIITNWHVVEGAKRVDVWLKPKDLVAEEYMIKNIDSYKAEVIKIDKVKDLALLKINGLPENIKPVKFGNYDDINIGETVFAIGHPGDLVWSFNSGMVSQKRPNYRWRYENSNHTANVIQTQTPINPGNSGGPLFNKNKRLVGVNTFTTDGENLNFAVSVNDMIEFINKPEKEILENKYIQKKKKGPTWITKKDKSKKKKNNIEKKYPNAQKLDLNDNGIIDCWLIDENKNGKIDIAVFDTNEDGIIEAVGFDENENANFEIFVFDDDLDGSADRAEIDEDDNGSSDVMAYDTDQDGKWDKYTPIS